MPEYKHTPCVLCLIENPQNHQLLMVKNLRGMNKGFYNFAGGKLNWGEDIRTALVREVKEETNLTLTGAKFVGRIDIVPADVKKVRADTKDCQVYVFYSYRYTGELKAADREVELYWFDRDKIPFENMRDNDRLWLPKVLNGEMVNMKFRRDQNGKLTDVCENTTDKNCQNERFRYYNFMKKVIAKSSSK